MKRAFEYYSLLSLLLPRHRVLMAKLHSKYLVTAQGLFKSLMLRQDKINHHRSFVPQLEH